MSDSSNPVHDAELFSGPGYNRVMGLRSGLQPFVNMKNKFFSIGIVGTILSALCCFTPILVWVLPALGLSAVLTYLDFVLLPALVVFLIITVLGYRQWRAAG